MKQSDMDIKYNTGYLVDSNGGKNHQDVLNELARIL